MNRYISVDNLNLVSDLFIADYVIKIIIHSKISNIEQFQTTYDLLDHEINSFFD